MPTTAEVANNLTIGHHTGFGPQYAQGTVGLRISCAFRLWMRIEPDRGSLRSCMVKRIINLVLVVPTLACACGSQNENSQLIGATGGSPGTGGSAAAIGTNGTGGQDTGGTTAVYQTIVNDAGAPCLNQVYSGNANDCSPGPALPCQTCIACYPLPAGDTGGCAAPNWPPSGSDAGALDPNLRYPVGCTLILPTQAGSSAEVYPLQCYCGDIGFGLRFVCPD